MHTLKHIDTWDRMPAALKEQVFNRLAELAERANLSEADQIAYDKAVDSYRVSSRVVQDHYELGLEEGIAKGKEEGKAEGKAEGMAEGKRLMAQRMKKMGIDLQTIIACSGLSKEEIESLE